MLAYLKLSNDFHVIRFPPGTWEVGRPTCSTAILRNAAVKTSQSIRIKIWAFNSDSYPCKYLLFSPVLVPSPTPIYQISNPNTRQELPLYPNFWRRGTLHKLPTPSVLNFSAACFALMELGIDSLKRPLVKTEVWELKLLVLEMRKLMVYAQAICAGGSPNQALLPVFHKWRICRGIHCLTERHAPSHGILNETQFGCMHLQFITSSILPSNLFSPPHNLLLLICFPTSAFFYDTYSCFPLTMHVVLLARPSSRVLHQHRLSWLFRQVSHCRPISLERSCWDQVTWEVMYVAITYMYGQQIFLNIFVITIGIAF